MFMFCIFEAILIQCVDTVVWLIGRSSSPTASVTKCTSDAFGLAYSRTGRTIMLKKQSRSPSVEEKYQL